ncbi:MAG TPA: gamma-glutamyl-gamma-aminobutyrate hydrolase family protein [Bacillaceae bacterium]
MIDNKPVIGLTCNVEMVRNNVSFTLYISYSEAIKRAGGIPIVLPLANEELSKIWVSMCDGFLLTGGNDIHPSFYGEEPHPKLALSTPKLDEGDLMIVKEATQQKKPLFGICRGSHLINVALGGTMIQDIGSEIPGALDHLDKGERTRLKHKIKINKDSTLYNILQAEEMLVNSFHHQGLGRLGNGLKCVATSQDGVVEAYESDDGLIMGTQFHPEEMGKFDYRMQQLLELFIHKCSRQEAKPL